MSINIRLEESSDIQSIHKVTVAAFLHAPHTGHTEQFIVKALRDSGALTISLVAEDSAQIVGHVALSPVTISDGSNGWYGLGPISVIPYEQGKGIGSKLMNAALAELKNLNANGCVLLGDPNFYHRFG
ncbi:MAG: N-acetyltransferase, partial [Halioglobus sp.]